MRKSKPENAAVGLYQIESRSTDACQASSVLHHLIIGADSFYFLRSISHRFAKFTSTYRPGVAYRPPQQLRYAINLN